MTTMKVWVAGARPKTLSAAIAPVLVGTAAGTVGQGPVRWERFALAAVVSLALQVGVNYANDYSDGVRGTDDARVGPVRITASGLATPAAVKRAAWLSFVVAAIAGTALALIVNPWLISVGVVAILAAWGYTGGPKPYGYSGLGELMVLVFFGFVATIGSAYVQYRTWPAAAIWGSLTVGLPACAVLLANNIRDVATDTEVGKRTLAVRVGARRARHLFVAGLGFAFVAIVPIAVVYPWATLGFLGIPFAIGPARLILTRDDPPALIEALVGAARTQLVSATALAVGLLLS